QKPYKTIPKKLRDYGSKHTSRIHNGDTESEDSNLEDEHNLDPKSESAENDKISDIINIYSY
ncbi:3388_t:CDS:2, partial [Funneliformis mosseae]